MCDQRRPPTCGMPRRKKGGQSPARVAGGPPESGSLGHNAAYQQTPAASNYPGSGSTSLSSSAREDTVRSMQEMFSHLDPEVIYIVLSECDFKAENAMDSLLELSLAAEGAAPGPSPVSGFEHTAAALLSPTTFSTSNPEPDSDMPLQQMPSSPSSMAILTEELDLLVDEELEKLASQQNISGDSQGGQHSSAFPPLPFHQQPPQQQQVLPELLQFSLQPGSGEPSAGLVGHARASVTCDQHNTLKVETKQQADRVTEIPADVPKPLIDLAASGRPSAFQVYKKQEISHTYSMKAAVPPSESTAGGTRSKGNTLNQKPIGYMQSPWNLKPPTFSPYDHIGQEPVFITPVAQPSSNWSSLPRNASPWSNQGHVVQAPLKPSATIPKSWALLAPNSPGHNKRLRLQGRVLVLLRGAPGSGKSTLARALVEHNPGAVSLSTDDYFTCDGEYHFDPEVLGEAHVWNQKRAQEAFERGANPIIIDNTNMQGWEMRPYVAQALKHRYKVLFREPDTRWKNKPRELERRSTHNVPVEKIRRMLNGYERFVTVQSIMGSHVPESKEHLPNNNLQSVPTEAPCPDLVGQQRLTGECIKLHPQLFCPLPDVSSVGQSIEVETPGDILHKSTESFDFQSTEKIMGYPELSQEDMDLDMADLDSLLDAQLELNHPKEDHRIPDCIVESVMNEDPHIDNMPVAFSESIGQRVRRGRQSRSAFDRVELADLVKGTSLPSRNSEVGQKIRENESNGVELANDGIVKEASQMFDGDWPTEESLQQRPLRKREKHKKEENMGTGVPQNDIKDKRSVQAEPKLTEFQKLLDLIQTGVPNTEDSLSPLSSSSSSSDFGQLEQDKASGGDCEEGDLDLTRADGSTGELPDCVLGWKAAESCKETETDILKDKITENKESCNISVYDGVFDNAKEMHSVTLKSTRLSNDLADVSKSLEPNAQNSDCGFKTEPQSGPTNVTTKMYAQSNTEIGAGSHISEVGRSAEVETESSMHSGGSHDKKQPQGRRSGKHCKLALTFTQNCPASPLNTLEWSNSSDPSAINRQEIMNTDSGQSQTAECDSSLSQEPIEPLTEVKSEAKMKPPSSPQGADERFSTQTEPQDFAVLWRLNRNPDASLPADVAVLSGNSSHFVPRLLAPDVSAAEPANHREVPYRMVHEKGTQVEETELGAAQDRLGDLSILRCHFKEVSYDTLVDLYDKCHQDLDWTTNLLLDSGEMFCKDEDGEIKDGDCNTSVSCEASEIPEETSLLPNAADESCVEHLLSAVKEETLLLSSGTRNELNENSSNASEQSFKAPLALLADANTNKLPQKNLSVPAAEHRVEQDNNQGHGPQTGSYNDHFLIEEPRFETEEDIASMNEVLRVLQEELDKLEAEERQKKEWGPEGRLAAERRRRHLDIQSVELKLPTELALQLTELFGPVGVDPGACSADDYAVQMDLNLAKMLHQKWKETIEEKQKNVALSFHLLQEGACVGSKHGAQSPVINPAPRDRKWPQTAWSGAEGWATQSSQSDASNSMPLMDHWNVSRPFVSLRDIIKEEQALQENMEKARRSRAALDRKDGAALLKENQLYALFPTIDRHFLQDIFRDHNYSLAETELFLRSLLGEEPVKTVVAPETARSSHIRAASKEREMRQKPLDLIEQHYQDTEDPEYEDFRAEACLHRRKQIESFSKAAEAFKRGRKEVASFYAEQGHLYGRQMRQANHRAAVQIFERVNRSLLTNNILDLHGLHVHEALTHLARVLEEKTTACEQGLCRPQLSVITGRGNHSQGGVPRLRPAVIEYLTNKHYRFTEPNLGLLLVSLK